MRNASRGSVVVGLLVAGCLAVVGSTTLDAGQKSAVPEGLGLVGVGPATPLYPGGVGLVRVTASRPLSSLDGTAFNRPVRFWSLPGGVEWRGLVGVSFDTKPGTHELVLQGVARAGRAERASAPLVVEAKRYETRRIQVAANMVNPPDSEAERIARDSKAMADAFANVIPERLWQGPFEAPVPGAATSSFGRLSVMNGEPRGRHLGADFRAAEGTPVRAPNGGRVALAQDLYFAGNTVIVDHGLGLFSLVAHLSSIGVSVGDHVAKGDLLGQSGSTGRVTGPHLHWAIRMGPMSVDPVALMAALSLEDAAP